MGKASAMIPLLIWLSWTVANAQLTWTPIFVAGNNQIDLWTQQSKGCVCPWDRESHQCACCVEDGGCHCGKDAPNRCTQCGLEKHCTNMCNVSIVSTELTAKSGKTFGQIKSPSLEGPGSCWYTFIPNWSQRIEIQIYRLVDTGRHNGTNCVGGYLQLASGAEPQYSYSDNQICGTNERYAPPVVFFSDEGLATLLFQVTEKTRRSQFLAYFSFTSSNNTDGLGYQPRGGQKLQDTDCDWLYQDTACNKSVGYSKGLGSCVLASPSYPGLYPPYRQCKYRIRTTGEGVLVKITFVSLLLPQNRCQTDYVAIYKGPTTNSPKLATLCNHQRKSFEFSHPDLLIEFSSGPQVPPYDYNGFLATLKFYTRVTTTEPPSTTVTTVTSTSEKPATSVYRNSTASLTSQDGSCTTCDCDMQISGNNTRFGHFDTREQEWFPECSLVFRGRPTDVVQLAFFNYRLTAPSCKSIIEILDGSYRGSRTPIDKICSPQAKQVRDQTGRILQQKTFLSTRNSMMVIFKRPSAPLSTNEAEFLTGAYYFHDEQIGGTVQPDTVCDVKYNGGSSPLAGMVDNPGSLPFYLGIEGPLSCRQHFAPELNQSITIRILGVDGMSKEPKCVTQCGDNGCQCVAEEPLKRVDHLMLVGEDGNTVACLCGSFQPEWLPVSVRTWGALTMVYSSTHYSWSKKRFGFSASYSFITDFTCGERIYTHHSGEITMRNLTSPDHLNHFFQQSCTWKLHSNIERQLELDISSTQNRPCTAWNITVHEYSDMRSPHLGELLHTFCPRDYHKQYQLRWNLNTVAVRLHTLSRTLPQFRVKWKSHVRERDNTKLVGPTPIPNASSGSQCFLLPQGSLPMLVWMVGFLCKVNVLCR